MLFNLQKWLEAQIDGDWEHEYSVKIETTDNPGWSISIPIIRTSLEGYVYEYKEYFSESDWFEISSNGNYFISYCSLNRIDYVLDLFLHDFFERANKNDIIYSVFYRYRIKNSLDIFLPLQGHLLDYKTFLITSIEDNFIEEIKVKDIEDFELLIDFSKDILKDVAFKLIDKKVICKSEMLYDYPALIITEVWSC